MIFVLTKKKPVTFFYVSYESQSIITASAFLKDRL